MNAFGCVRWSFCAKSTSGAIRAQAYALSELCLQDAHVLVVLINVVLVEIEPASCGAKVDGKARPRERRVRVAAYDAQRRSDRTRIVGRRGRRCGQRVSSAGGSRAKVIDQIEFLVQAGRTRGRNMCHFVRERGERFEPGTRDGCSCDAISAQHAQHEQQRQ